MHSILGQNNFDKYEFTRFRQLYIARYTRRPRMAALTQVIMEQCQAM
jgi:hypothetical protein